MPRSLVNNARAKAQLPHHNHDIFHASLAPLPLPPSKPSSPAATSALHQPLHRPLHPHQPPQCNPSAIQFSNEISTAAYLLRIVIYEHRTPPHIHALNLPPLLLLLLNNLANIAHSFFRGLFDLQMMPLAAILLCSIFIC
jgi:hypothetical protein